MIVTRNFVFEQFSLFVIESLLRLRVRTLPFHGGNTGSSPVGGTCYPFMINLTIFSSFLPEIVLCFLGLVQLIQTVGWAREDNFLLVRYVVSAQTFFILLIAGYILLYTSVEISTDLFINDLSCYRVKMIIVFFSMPLVFIVSHCCKFQKINFPEFMSLYLLSIVCLLLLISANDFLIIYVVLEIQTIISYAMTSMNRRSAHSTDAGLKYFILGAIFSCIFVFGGVLIYAESGTLNLEFLTLLYIFLENVRTSMLSLDRPFQFVGSVCILSTFFFKFGGAPFFSWIPDVYEGAPMGATIAISIVPKISLLWVTSKFMTAFHPILYNCDMIFASLGCITILVGTGFALHQKRMKRLLIYSSMTQTGFFFLALSTCSLDGTVALYLFAIAYLIGTSLLWSVLCFFYTCEGILASFLKNADAKWPFYVMKLANFFKPNKILGILICGIVFGVAGMPPSLGFLSKLWVLYSLIQSNLFGVSVCVVILSGYSYFYYIRIIKVIVFECKPKYDTKMPEHPLFSDELIDGYHTMLVVGVLLIFSPMHQDLYVLYVLLITLFH